MHEFPHFDGFSSPLFNALPVEIDTFITNIHILWPCCESVDLVLTFTAEGTLRDGAPLLFVVLPHMSSAFLSCLIALLSRKSCPLFISHRRGDILHPQLVRCHQKGSVHGSTLLCATVG